MKEEVPTLRRTVRYADDFVIMCRTKNEALGSIQVLKAIMKKLNTEKSKLVSLWDDTNGFDFLDLYLRKFPVMNKGGSKVYVMSHISK